MANRRKFLAGIGALASGSAAAVGTGAVSQITADRDFNLRIAQDQNAYLGLTPKSNANDFVNEASDGTLTIDFTSSVSGASGQGVNNRADTTLADAFQITNQSDRKLYVWAGFANPSNGNAVDPTSGGARSVELLADGDNSTDKDITYPGGEDKTSKSATTTSRVLGQTSTAGAIELGSGNSADVDIRLLVYGSNNPRNSNFLTVFRAEEDDPGSTTISDHQFNVNI
ncbi:hypothetical protein EXE51_12110 [Halorubrum sp. CGM5_25_10-8B]|uniref:hypothetical protein n=1 Tax=Halorubrum sp. CGM5_25_10-8B TaxID=2518115 RepID=UPI0010F709A0|nr:hypothetical protein [Halorubrum sp. CGM5_25_10-8B]TKX35928.1 hypothetical protein EXE51_12110 [Halorubrum sp. CGM5_25_10-8B]